MSKRRRYNSINECCSHLEQLRLNSIPYISEPSIPHTYNIDKIETKIDQLELSASMRFTEIDKKLKDVDTKLDKLVNLVLAISDNQLKTHPSCII